VVIIRLYNARIDSGICEFAADRTIVHVGSVTMTSSFDKSDFLYKFGREGLYLAIEGTSVVGGVLVAIEQEGSAQIARIHGIVVDVPCRRRGIGLQLVRQAEGYAEHNGADKVTLDARIDNVPALSLFRACGYTVTRKAGVSLRLEKSIGEGARAVMQEGAGDDRTLRVGIVGAGGNTTAKHLPGLQAIEGVEIVSLCNRSRASSERVAQQFGIPTIYGHWRALIDAPDTDAIVIGTWPYLHCRATLAALEAGKHVMCEARMAMDAQEAWAMLEAAQANPHLVAQVVPSPSTLRVDRTVQRLIAAGYLGELLSIEVRDLRGFLDREGPLHWRQDADRSGFNVMSLGIWYEALMRWVGEATRVLALGRTHVRLRRDPESDRMRAVRIPEHLDVIADMACGAQAHVQISQAAGLAGPREAWLFGSEGTLRFLDDRLFGGQRGDDVLHEIPIPAAEEGSWRVEREFVDAIRGQGVITHTTFEDGVKYMEFTEAVARSIAQGVAVALPL
jgi:predicted dehydrogenase/GNAT superfamily N-acetyltransferase